MLIDLFRFNPVLGTVTALAILAYFYLLICVVAWDMRKS